MVVVEVPAVTGRTAAVTTRTKTTTYRPWDESSVALGRRSQHFSWTSLRRRSKGLNTLTYTRGRNSLLGPASQRREYRWVGGVCWGDGRGEAIVKGGMGGGVGKGISERRFVHIKCIGVEMQTVIHLTDG